jgi:hypothetical protein
MQSSKKRPTLALDSSLVQDNTPIEIVPRLYIGPLYTAINQDALVSLGITHILNSSRLAATFPKLFTYLSIDIRDQEHANPFFCPVYHHQIYLLKLVWMLVVY